MWQIKFSAEDVGVVAGAGSDAAEAPAAAASSAAAVAADAAKDPQAAAPAPAEADSEDDSEDFALLGSLLFNPTTQLLKSNHPPLKKRIRLWLENAFTKRTRIWKFTFLVTKISYTLDSIYSIQ